MIKESFQADAAVWLRDESGLSLHPGKLVYAFEQRRKRRRLGISKKTGGREDRPTHLPDAESLHVPLVTGDRAEGVLTVRLASPPTLEQRELLDAFAAQLALFVNKERALEESREAQLARQSRETTESAFRFGLARIEDAARRHVGRVATAEARLR